MNNDLISRETALSIVERNAFHEGREWVFRGRIMRELEEATAVDAEPVQHGRWIRQDDTFTLYICSECKSRNHADRANYCPNCGAKMDGGGEHATD